MSADAMSIIDQVVANLERQLAHAKQIRDMLSTSPELAAMLIGRLSSLSLLAIPEQPSRSQPPLSQSSLSPGLHSENTVHIGGKGRPVGSTRNGANTDGTATTRQFEAMKKYFESQDNSWRTVKSISHHCHMTREAVAHILYRARKAFFEKRDAPLSGKEKEWRMRIAASATKPHPVQEEENEQEESSE